MILADVNALIYAFRPETSLHELARGALTESRDQGSLIILPDIAASFVRIVTDKRLSSTPDELQAAFEFIDILSARGRLLREARGTRWQSLQYLSERVEIRGPLVPGALLAATCLDFGASILTADRDFLRFPGVRVHLMTSAGIVDHTVT